MFVLVKEEKDEFVVDERAGGPIYRSRMNAQWRKRIKSRVRWHQGQAMGLVYVTDQEAYVHQDCLTRMR